MFVELIEFASRKSRRPRTKSLKASVIAGTAPANRPWMFAVKVFSRGRLFSEENNNLPGEQGDISLHNLFFESLA